MEVDFSKIIKELRERKKISQTELARKLNVTNSLISAYEAGTRQPSSATLLDIAKFFNVSMDYLYGLEDKKYIDVTKLKPSQISIVSELVNEFLKESHR